MTVEAYLAEHGASTALQIQQATGMTHEGVYARLVHLEAVGIVRLIRKDKTRGRLWEMA